MKKVLTHIRKKSPAFRLGLSFLLAFVFTVAVVVGYAAIRASAPHDTSDAPSPIGALVDSVKSAASGNSSSDIQVIDASNPPAPETTPVANDESDPYADPMPTN